MLGLLVAGAVIAYLATLTWGLGLPRMGTALSLGAVATAGAWLLGASWSPDNAAISAMNGASRMASGLLLGSTLTAMLLGHYYLTAPAMSIDPLKRAVAILAAALFAHAAGRGRRLGSPQGTDRGQPNVESGAFGVVAPGAVGPWVPRYGRRRLVDLENGPDPLERSLQLESSTLRPYSSPWAS